MKPEVLRDLEEKYAAFTKKTKLDLPFKDLDTHFKLTPYVLDKGYVEPDVGMMLCGRVSDVFNWWVNWMHSLIMPNPSSMISTSQSGLFDEEDNKEIMAVMDEFLAFTSKQRIMYFTASEEDKADYIKEAMTTWREHKDFLLEVSTEINEYWEAEAKKHGRSNN